MKDLATMQKGTSQNLIERLCLRDLYSYYSSQDYFNLDLALITDDPVPNVSSLFAITFFFLT